MKLTLASPEYLLLIPIWAGLAWMGMRIRLPLGYVAPPHRHGILKAFFPTWMTGIVGSLVTLALSEPVLYRQQKGLYLPDTWVLWDISQSMRLPDVPPERRENALSQIEAALSHTPSGRLGLIAFAAEAYAVLPLTSDREAFLFSLQQTTRLNLGEGTNLAAAIETALALAEGTVQLLIVSDGANNVPGSSSLPALADIAKARRIPIHTAFFGKEGEQTFPQALRLLSEKTGGTYQENTLSFAPLLHPGRFTHTQTLAPYLWGATLIVGLGMLAGMGIGGWFSVLTA